MLNVLSSIVIATLLFPSGFNFLTNQPVDYSYAPITREQSGPRRVVNTSLGIKATANNILIVDKNSQQVLYGKNNQEVVPIASITKLLTALVFLDSNLDWDQEVTIRPEDKRIGNRVYLMTGEVVTIKDLFYLSLIASSNEATAALARITGHENFAYMMNQKAVEIGMKESNFIEPTGLDENNVASLSDLILLANEAFSKTEITQVLNLKEYTFTVINNGRKAAAKSTDKLLDSFLENGSYDIIGAKTGYLDEAGYCLLTQIVDENGNQIIVALMNANDQLSRWQEAKGLAVWVFENYKWNL